jgi:hypothetical protein
MVATSSSTAIRRRDTAARPSASAMAMAVSMIRSRVAVPAPLRTLRGRAGADDGAGRPDGGPATTEPTPDRVRMAPRDRSSASTLVAVAIAIPHWRVIWRVDGARSPGFRSPWRMRSSIWLAIAR